MNQTIGYTALCLAMLCGAALAGPSAKDVAVAEAFLVKSLNDSDKLPLVLIGLRSTKDDSLAPLFSALMSHPDRNVRMLATASVRQAAGKLAIPALKERLAKDPSMVIRTRALLELDAMKAMTDAELAATLKLADQEVQLFAARALARRGAAAQARPTLKQLARSRDMDIAPLAWTTLLSLGDGDRLAQVRAHLLNKETDDAQRLLLLRQMADEHITVALPLAEAMTESSRPRNVRMQAWTTRVALDKKATPKLALAVQAEQDPLAQVQLLRLLAQQPDAAPALAAMAKQKTFLTEAVQFELARRQGGDAAQKATTALLKLGHPIMADHVLGSMRRDLIDHPARAGFYAQPVGNYLATVNLDRDTVGPNYTRAAAATEFLARLARPQARKALKQVLASKESTRKEVVVAALFNIDRDEVADMVAPLLKSPYSKLRNYSALVRAKHSRADATKPLHDILHTANIQPDDVLILASWYTLKLAKQEGPAIQRILPQIK
jgi:hypothetical protein